MSDGIGNDDGRKQRKRKYSYRCFVCAKRYTTHRKSRGSVSVCGLECRGRYAVWMKNGIQLSRSVELVPFKAPPTVEAASRVVWHCGNCVHCGASYVSATPTTTCSIECEVAHMDEPLGGCPSSASQPPLGSLASAPPDSEFQTERSFILFRCKSCGVEKGASGFYPNNRSTCKSCILARAKSRYSTDSEFRKKSIDRSRARHKPLPKRSCSRCGSTIRGSQSGKPGVCRACKHADGSGIKVSRAVRLYIYERDGWACQICGREVSKTLHPNHTYAATLDHIVPRSVLPMNDDPSNLRLAHRSCNSRRGNRVAAV